MSNNYNPNLSNAELFKQMKQHSAAKRVKTKTTAQLKQQFNAAAEALHTAATAAHASAGYVYNTKTHKMEANACAVASAQVQAQLSAEHATALRKYDAARKALNKATGHLHA